MNKFKIENCYRVIELKYIENIIDLNQKINRTYHLQIFSLKNEKVKKSRHTKHVQGLNKYQIISQLLLFAIF